MCEPNTHPLSVPRPSCPRGTDVFVTTHVCPLSALPCAAGGAYSCGAIGHIAWYRAPEQAATRSPAVLTWCAFHCLKSNTLSRQPQVHRSTGNTTSFQALNMGPPCHGRRRQRSDAAGSSLTTLLQATGTLTKTLQTPDSSIAEKKDSLYKRWKQADVWTHHEAPFGNHPSNPTARHRSLRRSSDPSRRWVQVSRRASTSVDRRVPVDTKG